jgi:diadenosine tetraphosphate (Ap4A) HIT family hydrolase
MLDIHLLALPQATCRLCLEMQEHRPSLFSNVYGDELHDSIVGSFEHLKLLLPVGPMLVGHTILAPVDHALGFRDFSGQIVEETIAILRLIADCFSKTGFELLAFEHGSC